jgi:hypothetical protein
MIEPFILFAFYNLTAYIIIFIMLQNLKEEDSLFLLNLQEKYSDFLESCLNYLVNNFESYRRVVFEDISDSLKFPNTLSLDSCTNFLLDAQPGKIDIRVDYKKGFGKHWFDNEIAFSFESQKQQITEWGTEEFWKYTNWRNDLEFECENEFWQNNTNHIRYNQLTSVNIFDDSVFKNDRLNYYQNKYKDQFNLEVWLSYIASLVESFFPEYIYSEEFSSKNVRRYLIQIKNGFWFGFEYSVKEIAKKLKRGDPELPNPFNLVVLAKSFNKNEKIQNYYYQPNKSISSLGILGNPFFYYPCYPFPGYTAVLKGRQPKINYPFLSKIVEVDKENYQIIHSKELGKEIKKHAFFYMDLLSSTAQPYLDYLKKVLEEVLK